MKKNNLFLILGLFCCFQLATSQSEIKHEKRIHVNKNDKVFIQKSLPVYIKLATSPNKDAKTYLLKSESTTKYSNPMYFDTDGRNTVRSPYAVDTSSLRIKYPLEYIVFEVYADGIAPFTTLKKSNTVVFYNDNKTYYGKGLTFNFISYDRISGVENIYYSINNSDYKKFSNKIEFDKEIEYNVKYYSVDYVGNTEETHSIDFIVDYTPPSTEFKIDGINEDNIATQDAKIILTGKDNISGVYKTYYSIGGGPFYVYNNPIPVKYLKNGDAKLEFYSIDNVNNKEDAKSLGPDNINLE